MTNILVEMLQLAETLSIEKDLNALHEIFLEAKETHTAFVTEGLTENYQGNVDAEFNELERLFAVARKGLSLANRLETEEQRRMHKARMMSHMNKIRIRLDQLMQNMGIGDRETRQKLNIANFPALRDAQDKRINYRDRNPDNDFRYKTRAV